MKMKISLKVFAEFVGKNLVTPELIYKKSESMELKPDKCAAVLAQILFTEKISSKEINNHAKLIGLFLTDAKSSIAFLGGIERFISKTTNKKPNHIIFIIIHPLILTIFR